MAKDSFMPLFVGDFLASTAQWPLEVKSLYLYMLTLQWSSGPFPEEWPEIGRILSAERKFWARSKKYLEPKFPVLNGVRFNPRLEEHRLKSLEISEKRRASGTKGGQTFAANLLKQNESKNRANARANAQVLLEHPYHTKTSDSSGVSDNFQKPHPVDVCNAHARGNSDESLEKSPCFSHPDAQNESKGAGDEISYPPATQVPENQDLRSQATRIKPEMPSELEIYGWICRIKAAYPEGSGRKDWITGETKIRQYVQNGEATFDLMLSQTEAYATFCTETNRMVLNPANFFGAVDKPWSQSWALPIAKQPDRKKTLLEEAQDEMREQRKRWDEQQRLVAEQGDPTSSAGSVDKASRILR